MTTYLRLDGWRSGIRFDAAHFIRGHPKCGRLHGHTYALSCVVEGEPATNGFILDFGEVKAALRGIADRFDHKVLVPRKAEGVRVEDDKDEVRVVVSDKRYAFPRADVVFLDEASTAENLAAHVARELVAVLGAQPNVRRVEVGVDEGYGKGAWARLVQRGGRWEAET